MESEYVSLPRHFHAASVEYVVVGGYAVVAHGYPRTTGNIDLFVNPTPANARRIVPALTAYGFTQGEFEESDFMMAPGFLSFSRAEAWIDLLTEVRGVSFAAASVQALLVEQGGLSVRYIGLAALRRAKAAAGRRQDLLDLENLPPA